MKAKLTILAVVLSVAAALAVYSIQLHAAKAATFDAKSPQPGAANADAAAQGPTFTRDIAPIVFDHCANCHRPGEVAPFALTSYKEVKKHARQIADLTSDRVMPPWKPEHGYGDFIGERRLNDDQIKLIGEWVKAGAPEGDPAALPPLPKFAEGWVLGEPDMVVKMPEAYTLHAEGKDVFRCFVIPLNLDEDKYVKAVDFRPGNPKIVHHALFFLDATGKARELDEKDPGPGYPGAGGPGFLPTGSLGGWSPGYRARYLPDDVGRAVRKGSDLIIQEHLHPSGKEEREQSMLGLYFAKTPPAKVTNAFPKIAGPINIPAGERKYEVNDTFTVPIDVTLIGITPHAHLLCKEIKVDANFLDGSSRPLIWIKHWDWNWQDLYLYQEPVRVPAGTKIVSHYVYDNSAENPTNPSTPPKRVRWGEQTTDEMAIVFFQIVSDRGAGGLFGFGGGGLRRLGGGGGGAAGNNAANANGPTTGPATRPAGRFDLSALPPEIQQMLIKRFDKNGNGKLDPDEIEEARQTFRRELRGDQ
jgi:mono/diheme cytochrome c family protein